MKTAIIGKKVGMTQIFDEAGKVVPVTVIEAGPCTVTGKMTKEKEGYEAVQLGYEDVAEKKLTKPEKGHLKKPGTAVWGTVLGCVLLLAVALGVLAALAVSPESVGAQLPMLDLACRLGTAGVVYAVLLFLGMFGTSVSSLVAVLTYAGQKSARLAGHRMALLLVLTAAAFAGSLFGFGDLIGTVYPVYGYLGMAAMLLVAEHAVHARRAGKHCAATGD